MNCKEESNKQAAKTYGQTLQFRCFFSHLHFAYLLIQKSHILSVTNGKWKQISYKKETKKQLKRKHEQKKKPHASCFFHLTVSIGYFFSTWLQRFFFIRCFFIRFIMPIPCQIFFSRSKLYHFLYYAMLYIFPMKRYVLFLFFMVFNAFACYVIPFSTFHS